MPQIEAPLRLQLCPARRCIGLLRPVRWHVVTLVFCSTIASAMLLPLILQRVNQLLRFARQRPSGPAPFNLVEALDNGDYEALRTATEKTFVLIALGHDVLDRLPNLECSTLIICGRYDHLTPLRLHRELAAEIPGARLVSMTYGGHLVMVESAERFNHMVLQFLDED